MLWLNLLNAIISFESGINKEFDIQKKPFGNIYERFKCKECNKQIYCQMSLYQHLQSNHTGLWNSYKFPYFWLSNSQEFNIISL
jgi:hypothetical protein